MRTILLLSAITALANASCSSIECGMGTIEKDGACTPASVVTSSGICGAGTHIVGDRCVSDYPPTVCDPATTTPETDTTTGVTTCKGMGGGGCSSSLLCPTPAAGKQTICGQIYDAKDNMPFAVAGAVGNKCTSVTTSGPCALSITAYDAIAFGTNPQTATPLGNTEVYIDDCGRYRISNVDKPASPYIGLGFDDTMASGNFGPNGVTNTTGIAVTSAPDSATKDVDAFVVNKATTDMWASSGGPPVSGGIYAAIFRTHKCDEATGMCTGDKFANQSGVTITKSGSTIPANDYYFTAADSMRTTIDTAATATGASGTVLVTNASVVNDPPLAYSGQGGITDTTNCKWEGHSAASIPTIVFFQIYRPTNQLGKTCAQ